MSVSLTKHPLKNHMPPLVSPCLMEDCGLAAELAPFLEDAGTYLTADPEAIGERAAILRLLLDDAALLDALSALKMKLDELEAVRRSGEADPMRVLDNLRIFPEVQTALQNTADTMSALPPGSALSEPLDTLRGCISTLFPSDLPSFFAAHLPERPVAVSYRLRFDDESRLTSVSLSEMHGDRYRKPGLFSQEARRLLCPPISCQPDDRNAVNGRTGLSEQQVLKMVCDRLLVSHTAQGKKQIDRQAFRILQALSPLHEQLAFFIGAAGFIRARLTRGHCFADCRPADEGVFDVCCMAHPHLGQEAVGNDLCLSRAAPVALVGGENRGGKTTFLRTAMAVQFLFQMGLPVPAERAALSPAEALYCVFDRDESRDFGQGKLGEELTQMRDALTALNGRGFFVFNEPLTSTSPQEGTTLSQEALCIVKLRGARGVWVTHFFSLFDTLDALNASLSGGAVFPLRTAGAFSIRPGIPAGSKAAKVFAGVRR